MKRAALVLLIVLAASPAAARERVPGLYGGFSAGVGRLELECDVCDHTSFELSGELGFAFAADVARRRLVGVHLLLDALSTWRSGSSHALAYVVGAGVRLWPLGRLWLDASLGYGGVSRGPKLVDTPDSEGLAVVARAGLELLRRDKLSIDVRAGAGVVVGDPTAISLYLAVGITFFGIAGDYTGPPASPANAPPPPRISN